MTGADKNTEALMFYLLLAWMKWWMNHRMICYATVMGTAVICSYQSVIVKK